MSLFLFLNIFLSVELYPLSLTYCVWRCMCVCIMGECSKKNIFAILCSMYPLSHLQQLCVFVWTFRCLKGSRAFNIGSRNLAFFFVTRRLSLSAMVFLWMKKLTRPLPLTIVWKEETSLRLTGQCRYDNCQMNCNKGIRFDFVVPGSKVHKNAWKRSTLYYDFANIESI